MSFKLVSFLHLLPARRYASAGNSDRNVSVRLSVRLSVTCRYCVKTKKASGMISRDLRSFVIRFDFESYVRFEIRVVLMVRFEIFESSALSIGIRKERLVVVKFAFKVDFGSKISAQQHCLTRFMTELK